MGSNIYRQKICERCGKEFTARTTVTRFCSHTCSSRAYKDRIRKETVEKIKAETIRIKTKEIREIQARDVLTVSEVATLVGCSRRTAYRLAATGTIKSGPTAHAHQTLRGGLGPVVPSKTCPARERVRHFIMLYRRRSPANIRYIGQDPPRHLKAERHPEVSAGQVR